jgi:molecular chaperone GrpE
MDTDKKKHQEEDKKNVTAEEITAQTAENGAEEQDGAADGEEQQEGNPGTAQQGETAKVRAELQEMKDKYLRLYSEFENFRRRTAKEKTDLLKSATQDLMTALLPVIDDLERARQATGGARDVEAVKEGVELVFHKLSNTLQHKGLKPMQAIGEAFDPEVHEAITQVPVQEEGQKGKVIDEVEKGYFLHDKVIRFAKVIIGA